MASYEPADDDALESREERGERLTAALRNDLHKCLRCGQETQDWPPCGCGAQALYAASISDTMGALGLTDAEWDAIPVSAQRKLRSYFA